MWTPAWVRQWGKEVSLCQSYGLDGKDCNGTSRSRLHRGTLVVEKCSSPLYISRLVIAPKYPPGQVKDDPDHGFRVWVNALINRCLKHNASTIPLATDEIKRLEGYKYYLQAEDGFSAYWSIPVCAESKRLTIFSFPHTRWHSLLDAINDGRNTQFSSSANRASGSTWWIHWL